MPGRLEEGERGGEQERCRSSPYTLLTARTERRPLLELRPSTLPWTIADAPLVLLRHHVELRPRAAAAWIRNELANSLRTRNAYQVNLLLGGFDMPSSSPALYWVDYLGTSIEVPFAAHGYGAHFTLSTMDRFHRPDMSVQEGIELLKMCIGELKKRFIVDLGTFKVRLVDRDGIKEITL